jgi:hypothetical protein
MTMDSTLLHAIKLPLQISCLFKHANYVGSKLDCITVHQCVFIHMTTMVDFIIIIISYCIMLPIVL